jgi:hypothetical protein
MASPAPGKQAPVAGQADGGARGNDLARALLDPMCAPLDPTGAPLDPTGATVDPRGARIDPTSAPLDPGHFSCARSPSS